MKREGTRVREVEVEVEGDGGDYVSAYAVYEEGRVTKLAVVNLRPMYANTTEDYTVFVRVAQPKTFGRFWVSPRAWVKRLTASSVEEKDAEKVTFAGQSFRNGISAGEVNVEEVGADGVVEVRGSEAVLVFFDEGEVYGKSRENDRWWSFW
jgi:hypothetical protein